MTEQTTTTTTTTTAGQPKPRIRPLGGARYLVESFTRPGLGHQVDVLRLRCGCEAGSYNRRCRHLVLALEFDAWRRREEAKARAATGGQAAGVRTANWSSAPAAAAQPAAMTAPATGQERPGAAAQVPWHESAAYRALAQAFE